MPTPARYALYHEDRTTLPEFIQATAQIAEMTPRNQTLPSLLGWDVLQHFRVLLNGRHSVTLERI